MFTADVPYVPPDADSIEIVHVVSSTAQPEFILRSCDEVTAGGTIAPASALVAAVLEQNNRQVSGHTASSLIASVKLTQSTNFEHGELAPSVEANYYEYHTEAGYLGKDQAIFLAEFEGKYYKIIANVIVSPYLDDNHPRCPEPKLIKVTRSSLDQNSLNFNWTTVSVNSSEPMQYSLQMSGMCRR